MKVKNFKFKKIKIYIKNLIFKVNKSIFEDESEKNINKINKIMRNTNISNIDTKLKKINDIFKKSYPDPMVCREVSSYEIDQAKNTLNTKIKKIEEKIDIALLMSLGDVTSGEKIFKKCAACHSIVKGGKNKIGPALYNVVGRQVGKISDYKYSKSLANYDKKWTFEELNGFLIKPAKYIKGTKMSYAGLRKEKDRASVIKYLNENSDSPLALP